MFQLRHDDGRYLACYLWSSKVALWTDDVRKAWWGDIATAYKIQDQWGASSSPLRAIDKTAHLEELLIAAKRDLDTCKKVDASTITNTTEYEALEATRRKAFRAYTHLVCTIDDVGAE